ncbi:MAG: SDR family NAD(P)-dependent oxidoreductase [Gemmataceae bacterium]
MLNSSKKVAIITGASSGIGFALAEALAAANYNVGAVARRTELLQELQTRVQARGQSLTIAQVDVGQRQATVDTLRRLQDQLGPVDLLIANAGVGVPSGAREMQIENVELMMQVNYFGVVYAFEALLPSMIERNAGHLVAVSSLAAYKGLPGSAGYCASKAAVNNYCESLRIELSRTKVDITVVCPGFIDTPMTKQNPRPMPLLMSPEKAATRILRGIARRPGVFNFPWRMWLLMQTLRWLPDSVIARRVLKDAPVPTPDQ